MSERFLDTDLVRRLEQVALVSRKLSTGRLKGERRSRRRGSSTDFADYRNYVPGDDLRFLDWKLYGRHERLFLKLFLEEEDLRVHLLIDTSASMAYGTPAKLRHAQCVAAALGYVGLARMDSLCAYAFAGGLRQQYGPRRGKQHRADYFDFLDSLAPEEGPTSLQASFKTFAAGVKQRGLAVVLSDFCDPAGYEDAFRQLFARDFEVLAIQILAPEELAPDYEGDLRLVDAETDAAIDVSMGREVLGLYARTLSAFTNGLKDHIVSRGGSYLLTSTAQPVDTLVLDILRRKGVLR